MWKHAIRFGCDIVHVGMPLLEVPIPVALERACRAKTIVDDDLLAESG